MAALHDEARRRDYALYQGPNSYEGRGEDLLHEEKVVKPDLDTLGATAR